ncbi:hypothetical protein [Pseudomonas sp. UBA1879]|uniref:hypothetical protein n=1 Tax=Pseudomonas sp. UBA1879 TaxID=1947305 RepID=UPI0025F354D1|nr:hypothetical protein [Pseudomonas sp. UBA1879]
MNPSISALFSKPLDPKFTLDEHLRPDLPSLTYDVSFAAAGKLLLPMDGRTGWASCIIPSVTHPGMYLVAFYEVIKIVNPPPSYLARLVRITQDGTLDPAFANGEGAINVSFAKQGISIVQGIHEDSEGNISLWGTNTALAGSSFISSQFISKKLPSGQPDTRFGESGSININALGLKFDVQLVGGNALSLLPDGSAFIGLSRRNTDVGLIAKLSSTGYLDTTFQNQGTLIVTNDGKSTYLHGVVSDGHDGLLAYGATAQDEKMSGVLMKYDRAGNKVQAFGKRGATHFTESLHSPIVTGIHLLNDKRMLATGSADTLRDGGLVVESLISVVSNDGKFDKGFNSGKPGFHRFSNNSDFDIWFTGTRQLQSDGKILAMGSGGPEGSTGPVIGRFNPDGSPDGTLAEGSPFGTLPDSSFFTSPGSALNTRPDQILAVGSASSQPAVLAIKI